MSPRAESTSTRPRDPRIRRFIATVAVTGAAGAAAALALAGPAAGFSVAVGACVATANLWALARIVVALLPVDDASARGQSRAAWALVGTLKMLGLVALLWLLIRHGFVSPFPMFLGLGALPIGIAIGSLVSDRKPPSEDRP